ncbi:TonB-dependent receptor [Pinibacter soli]|uniref:TonB-dependent receptor n=1 Tax=Pinibacter soli TaxID=3044211 RepID=A0ABT6R9F7_9BACT|nr:TonB-dependent receptor [Pinibacter soli]MDI3319194.1 TonB-dependent receptor [Pinibacter soli]
MRSCRLLLCLLILTFSTIASFAQVTITGNVKNSSSNEMVAAASVAIKGTGTGTFTDDKGNFKLVSKKTPPFTLVVSSVGYESREVIVTSTTPVTIVLDPAVSLGSEIVVSASRVPERILESPVSIERVNAGSIRVAPATSYYDIIGNLKGVDMTTSSLTFKTPSTRGFNASGNTRLNQIVDGMDNQAPGLNFSVGGVVGLTELDVESIELLSGASSALYGPGGMNGTILINSKDPFKYPGVSAQVKGGVMNINSPVRNTSAYQDYSIRWAQKISNKFAFKVAAQYMQANDWAPYDSSNYDAIAFKSKTSNRATDPNYNGVNVYGDETTLDIRGSQTPFIQGVIASLPQNQQQQVAQIMAPYLSSAFNVSRTGYNETDIVDPKTYNLKLSGGLYYKITDKLMASVSGYWGTGTTVYTGSDRYVLKDLKMGQYKLELKSKNWFLRGYTTQENSGKSYNATVSTRLTNEAWRPSYNPANPLGSWYPRYSGAFVQGAVTTFQQAFNAAIAAGQNPQQAAATAQAAMLANTTLLNNIARGYADSARPAPGSAEFKNYFNSVITKPIPQGGLFVDRSDLYMVEGQYNLTEPLNLEHKGTDILVGGNWKQYVLNSQGTIFADTTGKIKINEMGVYAQISQKLFGDALKLTASGRYDKNENFDGKFTPRFSAVVKVAKDQNIRLSYQTAYRFPTTQNQWINLQTGTAFLIGGLPQLREGHHFDTNPVYTQDSYLAFAGSGDPSKLVVQQFNKYKPETSNSYEVGYKGLFANKLMFDVYGYYAHYKDFLGRINVVQSSTGEISGLSKPVFYSVAVNSASSVNTYGYGFSVEYLLRNNFSVNGNFYSDDITNVPANFQAQFNTPKYRTNIGIANSGFGWKKRMGFNVVYRWQDSYYNESTFINGNVSAFSTVDAMVSLKLPDIKSMIKLGGTNITNHYYLNSYGNPRIGGLYYVSFAYNVL